MKEEQVIKFIEKLDYSYEYKTVNERQNMITELCLIAGTKQLTIPVVTQRSKLLIDFAQSMEAYAIHTSEIGLKEGVAKYLKSINCG
jgi:hypothetical protein